MSNFELIEPNAPGGGSIGILINPWGAVYANGIYVRGAPVATLQSPVFVGNPLAPTAAPGTNTTQISTTAFVLAEIALNIANQVTTGGAWSGAGKLVVTGAGRALTEHANSVADLLARANHTGSQLFTTIGGISEVPPGGTDKWLRSDGTFRALTAGDFTGGHTQGTDQGLDTGGANAVTAAALRVHLDNIAAHRVIDDAGIAVTDLWSASKIIARIAADLAPYATTASIQSAVLAANYPSDSGLWLRGDNTWASLPAGSIDPEEIMDLVATFLTSANGITWTHDDPGDTLKAALTLKSTGWIAGEGALRLDAGAGFYVVLGTTSTTAAAGNDSRFPTADEKDALAGNSPSGTNKYVTSNSTALTTLTSADPAADWLEIWDADAGARKKVLPNNLGIVGAGSGGDVYHDTAFTSLLGGTAADLDSLATAALDLGRIQKVVTPDLFELEFRLVAGAIARTTIVSVNDTTDVVTVTAHGLYNGQRIVPLSSKYGLTAGNIYYLISKTTNTFKLSTSKGGAAFNLTPDTGTFDYRREDAPWKVEPTDYAVSTNERYWECVGPVQVLHFETLGFAETVNIDTYCSGSVPLFASVKEIRAHMCNLPAGSGSGHVDVMLYFDSQACFAAEWELTSKIMGAVADSAKTILRPYLAQGETFSVIVNDEGGSVPGEGLGFHVLCLTSPIQE